MTNHIRLAVGLTVLISITLSPQHAFADGNHLTKGSTTVQIKAWKAKQHASKPGEAQSTGSSEKVELNGNSAKQQKAWQDKVQHVIAYNKAVSKAQAACVDATASVGCATPKFLTLEGQPAIQGGGDDPGPAAPAVSPQQAAYIAVARLKLTPPKPMIGPPPSINDWKMAAVGYPLWLWADGNLDPAPVTDSVYDISVRLDARLVKVVYEMGDGHKVTCTNVTRAWSRQVTPGTPSPDCGYAYQKPSLPKGKYTITANVVWAVDWNVNGTTGTIPFYQSATTELPVGELQVLVH